MSEYKWYNILIMKGSLKTVTWCEIEQSVMRKLKKGAKFEVDGLSGLWELDKIVSVVTKQPNHLLRYGAVSTIVSNDWNFRCGCNCCDADNEREPGRKYYGTRKIENIKKRLRGGSN